MQIEPLVLCRWSILRNPRLVGISLTNSYSSSKRQFNIVVSNYQPVNRELTLKHLIYDAETWNNLRYVFSVRGLKCSFSNISGSKYDKTKKK